MGHGDHISATRGDLWDDAGSSRAWVCSHHTRSKVSVCHAALADSTLLHAQRERRTYFKFRTVYKADYLVFNCESGHTYLSHCHVNMATCRSFSY